MPYENDSIHAPRGTRYNLDLFNLDNGNNIAWENNFTDSIDNGLTANLAGAKIIAANKADLHSSEKNISKLKSLNRLFFPCVSEAELLLKRALQKNIIYYLPGDSSFEIKNKKNLSDKQKEALITVSKVLKKFGSTGVQNILNHACFKILDKIVVYPVEDELKFTDKKGNVLPDARIV